jgi:hypothetical protein
MHSEDLTENNQAGIALELKVEVKREKDLKTNRGENWNNGKEERNNREIL